ncbi:MAG: glycosyltransferase, partial [Terriglobia bacterium]
VADLILSRAGATTIAELTAVGLPSVLVPYPYAVDDHQRANARVLEAHGAARVISDADLTAESLAATVVGLVSSDRDLAQMRGAALECGYPRAASALADLVYQVGQGGPRVASEESGGNG